ncbi:MAG TPA: hypothetical protein VIM07_04110 [Chitinophagaceae bacterium]
MRNILFCVCIFVISSCASIVSKSSWPFSIQTDPPGAKVVITNKRGIEILNKRTPTALLLRSGAGFFSKESYIIALSMDGYETKKINVECKINGWYFGNILIGGVIGMLIVDPATGAMYKLDREGISETLVKNTVSGTSSLNIISKDQIPKGLENHLVKLN